MSVVSETDVIDIVRRAAARERNDIRLGIGDDASVLAVPGGYELVAASDTIVRGVHYPEDLDPRHIGHRALAVNLSDLAAMGAMPAWCLMALSLPNPSWPWVGAFASGFAELAQRHHVALTGGDTVRGPEQVAVTVLGLVPIGTAVSRSGARAGHEVWVTGTLGDAAFGLKNANPDDTLFGRFAEPEPRVAAGLRLRGLASAMIDISDGLAVDTERLAGASGVGAEIDVDRLPISTDLADRVGPAAALEFALAGGDDYELLFTVADTHVDELRQRARHLDTPVARIGRIVDRPGVRFTKNGQDIAVPKTFTHFGES